MHSYCKYNTWLFTRDSAWLTCAAVHRPPGCSWSQTQSHYFSLRIFGLRLTKPSTSPKPASLLHPHIYTLVWQSHKTWEPLIIGEALVLPFIMPVHVMCNCALQWGRYMRLYSSRIITHTPRPMGAVTGIMWLHWLGSGEVMEGSLLIASSYIRTTPLRSRDPPDKHPVRTRVWHVTHREASSARAIIAGHIPIGIQVSAAIERLRSEVQTHRLTCSQTGSQRCSPLMSP